MVHDVSPMYPSGYVSTGYMHHHKALVVYTFRHYKQVERSAVCPSTRTHHFTRDVSRQLLGWLGSFGMLRLEMPIPARDVALRAQERERATKQERERSDHDGQLLFVGAEKSRPS